MASISRDPNGRRRILFVDLSGNRKAIRLGKVSIKQSEEVRLRVEKILASVVTNTAIDGDTAKWLSEVPDVLYGKLVNAGLVAVRQTTGHQALAKYVEAYRKHRADVATGTNTNYGIVGNRLLAFFPGDRLLHTITEGDADRWLVWLKTKYAGPTVSKSVKVARQFWAQAIRDGLATKNPFAHLRTPSEVNTARAHFVDRSTFECVLEACPSHQWRLLLALARYGGLRTPSEPTMLEFADINGERNRFRVSAPKTEHEDGGDRWVPIFPELRPFLEEAFELAPTGAVHVVTIVRDPDINLRTQFSRIIRRAGVRTWPRLFQNLRASRETELAETSPIHVVAEWLGNSPKTALAHYTQVTEEHFREAATRAAQQPARNAKQGFASEKSGLVEIEVVQPLAIPCDY